MKCFSKFVCVMEIDTRSKTQKLHHLSPKGDNCTSSAADLKKLKGARQADENCPGLLH